MSKTAVVTGGSRGIGFETAKKLIGEGYKVAICSRSEKEIKESVKKLGENCSGFKCDVSNSVDVGKLLKRVVKSFGKIDVLVNNAGVAVWKDFAKQSEKEIETQTRINLEG